MSEQGKPTRADFSFWWPLSVRWSDMDAMGHVNNAVYLRYVESARVGYFEAWGWEARDASPARQGPVVVSQTFNYRRQLHYPAEVEVGLECVKIGRRSFVLSCAIFRKGDGKLIGDGSCTMAWLDYGTGRAVELPPTVRECLKQGRSAGSPPA